MIRFRIGLLSLIFCCLTNFVWAQGSNAYELSSNTLIHLRQAGLPLEILRDLQGRDPGKFSGPFALRNLL